MYNEECKLKDQPPEAVRVRFTNTLRWDGQAWQNLLYHRDAQLFEENGRQTNSIIERNKELVLTMNHEVWNEGNLEVTKELFLPDFVQHFLPSGSDLKGINALREEIKKHREAFPDWSEHINHIVAEDDLVVIQFESSGTNLGSWLGNPPTGKKVKINEFSILRIEDGRIAEQWLMPDLFNLRKQLGFDNR